MAAKGRCEGSGVGCGVGVSQPSGGPTPAVGSQPAPSRLPPASFSCLRGVWGRPGLRGAEGMLLKLLRAALLQIAQKKKYFLGLAEAGQDLSP